MASDYLDWVDKAEKAIKESKWSDAEQALREALRSEPGNPGNVLLMSNLGMILYYDGRTEEALSTLTQAHDIAPRSVTVLMNRARIYSSTGRTEQAKSDYSTVITLDSTLAEPRFYRAMISLHQGSGEDFKADLDTLAAMAPEHRLTHLAQATLLMETGQYREAIPHLTAAIDSDADASYYGSRAFCYLLTGDLQRASDDIAKGLELDPTDGELYLYRGLLNKMRYRPSDAKADGDKAIKYGIDPKRVKQLL